MTVLAGATSRRATDASACWVPTPPGVTAKVDEIELAAMIRKMLRIVTGMPNADMYVAVDAQPRRRSSCNLRERAPGAQ